MGRGNNRRSRKMIQRISWRKNKARLKKRIEDGKAGLGKTKTATSAKTETPAVTRRANEE